MQLDSNQMGYIGLKPGQAVRNRLHLRSFMYSYIKRKCRALSIHTTFCNPQSCFLNTSRQQTKQNIVDAVHKSKHNIVKITPTFYQNYVYLNILHNVNIKNIEWNRKNPGVLGRLWWRRWMGGRKLRCGMNGMQSGRIGEMPNFFEQKWIRCRLRAAGSRRRSQVRLFLLRQCLLNFFADCAHMFSQHFKMYV